MKIEERKPTNIVSSAKELRRLIIDNPNLPLVVFAGEDANCCNYMYTACTWVNAYVGEFLDCMQDVNDEKCYCDRDEFEEDLADTLEEYFEESQDAFDMRVQREVAEYDPYWKPCIILYVNN